MFSLSLAARHGPNVEGYVVGVVVGVVGEILSQEVARGASKRAINNPMRETRTFKTVIVNMNRNNRGVIPPRKRTPSYS
jgi:hypothetical protein